MSIEDLTKTQMILLTLLVSFVTSIATGIVTVALLAAAPPAVTQTVNRVIQNTIEKVVPGEGGTTTQTVIVKEEDLVVDAIDQNAKSLVAIKEDVGDQKGLLLGTGFLISKDGLVITDASGIVEHGNYFIASNGTDYAANVIAKDSRGFAFLKAVPVKDEKGDFKSFGFSTLGDSNALKVGQTVISPSSLDGESVNVAKGIISRLIQDPADASTISSIILTMSIGRANSGSPLLDTDGAVIGLVLVKNGSVEVIPSAVLKTAVAALPTAQ